jgi:hypothetical protein
LDGVRKMTYEEWAMRWALPPQAIQELMLITARTQEPLSGHSEEVVAAECRLELGKHGIITMRNNVGVLEDINGRPVRYGLCNETKAMNQALKSSDDILAIPYVVKPHDVGRTIGRIGGLEYKKRNWVFTGQGREAAQSNFHRMLNSIGGIGLFANSGRCVIDTLVSHGLISQ